jgi:4-hydroxybenzoate polyprenyltransferase
VIQKRHPLDALAAKLGALADRIARHPYVPVIRERAGQYARLMRLDKPVGIFLLLWPTLSALWIAGLGRPDPGVVVVFVLGVVLMRSAGCVINDYADRRFDPHVARTRDRPIAAGKVGPREALYLFIALVTLAYLLVLTMNAETILLAFGGALLAATYPFSKRYTYLPQVHLGLAFGWAVPMAFAAQTGGTPRIAWLLYIATVLWAVVYDTMYAMADREEDIRVGVKSTAILFDEADRLIIGMVQALMLTVLFVVGFQAKLGLAYHLGLAVAAGLCAYHQYLIRRRDVEACLRAFRTSHWLGAAVFAGIWADFLLRR